MIVIVIVNVDMNDLHQGHDNWGRGGSDIISQCSFTDDFPAKEEYIGIGGNAPWPIPCPTNMMDKLKCIKNKVSVP